MAGGGGNQTTRTEPPKYQLPYLQDSLQYAQNQYLTRPATNNVAPFSGESEQALTGIATRATAGSPITSGARDLATQTLSGGFLGSNPYLDQTFNRAALATENQLASQFGRSGRNVEASEGLRSQQLNDLATGIYGGAYDAERNRQQQVLGMSGALANQDYADFDRLLDVGGRREGYQQELLDAPGQALDDYIRRISGNMGSTTITPMSRNRGAGALGGALTGAQLGSVFPGIGTILGGIGGGILGGWG